MVERIQKIISEYGVASRRNAEKLIEQGKVTCNGRICLLGEKADPTVDVILIEGKPLPQKQNHVYIMLNKPRGFVTTLSDEKGRKNAAQLVSDCGCRVYPVGRLDMDSDGLLLFTNDGETANKLMHPSHEVNKTYRVVVSHFSHNGLQRLQKPIVLDGYTIKKPIVRVLEEPDRQDNAVLSITIHEGRNRQVRRMCAIAGMVVRKLTRTAEGNLILGELPIGKWRFLNEEEIAEIKK